MTAEAASPPQPTDGSTRVPRLSKGKKFGRFGCNCCDVQSFGGPVFHKDTCVPDVSVAAAVAAFDGCRSTPYVDTHCHLDLVLKLYRRWQCAPSAQKRWKDLTVEEARNWRLLGWTSEAWHARDIMTNPIWARPWQRLAAEEQDAAVALGWNAATWKSFHWPLPYIPWEKLPSEQRINLEVLGENEDSWSAMLKCRPAEKRKKVSNLTWYKPWTDLTRAQQDAASALGWNSEKWGQYSWHLPDEEWTALSDVVRSNLAVLGETEETWAAVLQSRTSSRKRTLEVTHSNSTWKRWWSELNDVELAAATALGWDASRWNRGAWPLPGLPDMEWTDLDDEMRSHFGTLGETPETWVTTTSKKLNCKGAGYGGDWREWTELNEKEREVASCLGFSAPSWNTNEMADLKAYFFDFCGRGFEWCIAQGCDLDSIDDTIQLALAHPQVYASFGCHPKSAYEYNDVLEKRLLAAFEMCGSKAVAWGECGLDYSNKVWGYKEEYRQHQRTVFIRQLQLAIERNLPVVVHTRDSADDALCIIRQHVPRKWKIHMHSFLGGLSCADALISEYPNCFFGLTGTVTMGGEAEQMGLHIPLNRMLIETDSPCIAPRGIGFGHVGQIPYLIRSLAELRGCSAEEIFRAVRENARVLYGI